MEKIVEFFNFSILKKQNKTQNVVHVQCKENIIEMALECTNYTCNYL